MTDRILGIDPGLQRTGYAVIERRKRTGSLLEGGVLRSDPTRSLPERILEIASGLREIIGEFQPSAMAVEQAIVHGRNFRSSLLVAQVRGAVLLVAADAQLPVIHIAPTEVKRMLTGSGRATKAQVQSAVQNELRLLALLEPHDVADASAVALTVMHRVKFAA